MRHFAVAFVALASATPARVDVARRRVVGRFTKLADDSGTSSSPTTPSFATAKGVHRYDGQLARLLAGRR